MCDRCWVMPCMVLECADCGYVMCGPCWDDFFEWAAVVQPDGCGCAAWRADQ